MDYTLKQLLDELSIPEFKVGQIFETQITFFPDTKTPREKKNLTIKNITFTKPLASSKKDKKNYFKEQSPVKMFYNNKSRGDILEIVEVVDKDSAKCINISLKEDIRDKYYKDEFIIIDKKMLIEGYIKNIQRNVNKTKNEASMKAKELLAELTQEKETKIIGFLKKSGYSQNDGEKSFDSKQLKDGEKIESKEHGDSKSSFSKKIGKEIAKNHLKENPKYYSYLKKMEKEMDKEKLTKKLKGDK